MDNNKKQNTSEVHKFSLILLNKKFNKYQLFYKNFRLCKTEKYNKLPKIHSTCKY